MLSHPGISKPCLLSFPLPCPSSSFFGFHIVNLLCNALLPSLPTYRLGALHSQLILWMTALILSITAQRSLQFPLFTVSHCWLAWYSRASVVGFRPSFPRFLGWPLCLRVLPCFSILIPLLLFLSAGIPFPSHLSPVLPRGEFLPKLSNIWILNKVETCFIGSCYWFKYITVSFKCIQLGKQIMRHRNHISYS